MQAIVVALAVLAVLNPVDAFSCYIGTSTSDSAPGQTGSGCWQCTKSVTKIGSSTTYQFSGICTNYPTIPTAAYTAYTGSVTVPSVTAGSCQWYAASYSATGGASSLLTGAAAATGGTNYCLSTTSINTCSSQWDSGMSATCVCCSDNCNNMKCGATAIASSILGMTLFALIAFALRQ